MQPSNRDVDLDELQPHPKNYNRHPAEQVRRLAKSLTKFGQVRSVVVWRNTLLAGHGVAEAARILNWRTVRADVLPDDYPEHLALAYIAADNELARQGDPDMAQLAAILEESKAADADLLEAIGYSDKEFDALLREVGKGAAGVEDAGAQVDKADELRQKWGTAAGQLWQLGEHRLICGDCTDAATVARVMGGERAALVHADPPYGMGKEKDGIANDNLYREKLDTFQMAWWRACRSMLDDNGSVYIWGNADDLWRLWYCGGLRDSERLTLRNEIVWQKQGAQGIRSETHRQYPTASERCLFFMLGEQGFNNNADNWWDGWEPIRGYLDGERIKMGWSKPQVETILGSINKTQHTFSQSHFNLIQEVDYLKLQTVANGRAFQRDYDELKRDFYITRAYFDNTHDNMTDVWQFGRVTGDDRHDHATPKPTDMIARVVKSSAPDGAIVYVPFGGTLPEVIACENLGRRCRAVEISPAYVAVALERWAMSTGKTPVLVGGDDAK